MYDELLTLELALLNETTRHGRVSSLFYYPGFKLFDEQ